MLALAGAMLVHASAAAQSDRPRTVPAVDLDRYAGRWYEIARFPNRFQAQCVADVTATYALRDDGRVDVVNRCRREDDGVEEARGVARVARDALADGSNARLEVRFAPRWLSWLQRVWGDYWVIDLADDYSVALVGSPDREYLWVLSRTPRLDESAWQRLLTVATREGYAVDRLVRTEQDGGTPRSGG